MITPRYTVLATIGSRKGVSGITSWGPCLVRLIQRRVNLETPLPTALKRTTLLVVLMLNPKERKVCKMWARSPRALWPSAMLCNVQRRWTSSAYPIRWSCSHAWEYLWRNSCIMRPIHRVQRMGASMDPCLIPLEASIVPIKDLKGM